MGVAVWEEAMAAVASSRRLGWAVAAAAEMETEATVGMAVMEAGAPLETVAGLASTPLCKSRKSAARCPERCCL